MYRFKPAALYAVALTTLAFTGCATTEPGYNNADSQKQAMQRWDACLERNATVQTLTAMRISRVLEHQCEGHTRDVVATFPRHQAEQVDQMLIGRAYRLLETQHEGYELSAEQAEVVHTLLLR